MASDAQILFHVMTSHIMVFCITDDHTNQCKGLHVIYKLYATQNGQCDIDRGFLYSSVNPSIFKCFS